MRVSFVALTWLSLVTPALADSLVLTGGGMAGDRSNAIGMSVQGPDVSLVGGDDGAYSADGGRTGDTIAVGLNVGTFAGGTLFGTAFSTDGSCFASVPSPCAQLVGHFRGSLILPINALALTEASFVGTTDIEVWGGALHFVTTALPSTATVRLVGSDCLSGGGFCYQLGTIRVDFAQPVPEPATWLLLASGALLLLGRRARTSEPLISAG